MKKEVLEKVVNELRLQTVGRTKLQLEETITKWATATPSSTRRAELEALGVCFPDDDKKKDEKKKDDPDDEGDPDDEDLGLPDSDSDDELVQLVVEDQYFGKTYYVDAALNEPILVVKAMLRKETGISIKRQILIFHDQELADDIWLGEIGIKDKDKLQMIIKLSAAAAKRARGEAGATTGSIPTVLGVVAPERGTRRKC